MLILVSIPLLVAAAAALRFCLYLRMLNSPGSGNLRLIEISSLQYRPMLRLLAEEDFEFVDDPALRRNLRTHRRQVFRGYLRRLAKDYGRVLAGIRLVMVQSGVDRPDLARALVRNKLLFAGALVRIDIRLGLHAMGIGKVDASRLVDALEILRTQVRALGPLTSQ